MGKRYCKPGPRNLKGAQNYTVGLDLGTASVGWAVVNENGELYRVNGNKPTWGARLFPEAKTAAETRKKRGQRRRYERRRRRIEALQEIFCEEMEKVDPEFFIRMRQSHLVADDRDGQYQTDYAHPFFNGSDFTESAYYKDFPTIWHLRSWLMETDEKADIRLVYLALHNIVKYRGNFLYEDEGATLTAANADARVAAEGLVLALTNLAEHSGVLKKDIESCKPNVEAIKDALEKPGITRAGRGELLANKISEITFLISGRKGLAGLLGKACVGLEVVFRGKGGIFLGDAIDDEDEENKKKNKFKIFDEDKAPKFADSCDPDTELPLFEAIQRAYSAFALSGVLSGPMESEEEQQRDPKIAKSLSSFMVASYNRHKTDKRIVKELAREYLSPEAYRALFRRPKDSKGSYTAYIERPKTCSQEDLVKNIRKHFDGCPELKADDRYAKIAPRLEADDGSFLAKQKRRENGAIPYQLHLEEMSRIIEKQGVHYPFLLEAKDLLERIVSSRIPYYVGPLDTSPDNPGGATRKFAWAVRREGKEGVEVHPWNVDEVIDVDETAKRFIERMMGKCTYLYGEYVLPRCSLLYEEFCVLNELNGARWADGSADPERFDAADRRALVEDVFKKRKSVPHRAVAGWLTRKHGAKDPRITGTQDETAFESKLNSYYDFCRILGVERLEDDNCPLKFKDIEQIILWNTVFEDRAILRRKLEQEYGDVLTEKQREEIVRKRYTGWGRLSKKFLTGLKAQTTSGPMSIMDVLRDGDPYPGRHQRALNLMEALRDKDLDFQGLVDRANEAYMEEHGLMLGVDDLQGSPALRRTVNQAMRVLDELVSIAGKPPARICIETTHHEDQHKKGKRTDTRYNQLKQAVKQFQKDKKDYDKTLVHELEESKDRLDDDRLLLYFAQAGKSLYSEKPLDIRQLHTYQIDHILPQSYIKDDSLDNRALVLQSENQNKSDMLLLNPEVIRLRRTWWFQLKEAGLISEKKYALLTRKDISPSALKGFINRQLVETSQVVKFVRQLCAQRYPATKVVPVRASLSHDLREELGLAKCRELNNYHHAHDAYLACQIARFLDYRYPSWSDGFNLEIVRRHVKNLDGQSDAMRNRFGKSGFIVGSFMRSGFDKKTGEVFKDGWDSEATIARIRADLDSKHCFISRMPEEQTGAFWDETVYSPREKKNGKGLDVPLDSSGIVGYLKPSRYGVVKKVYNAYYFIFAAKDKKGKYGYFLEGVPIHLAQRINKDRIGGEALRAYEEEIANYNGYEDVVILKDRVRLWQKFEMNGRMFYLRGGGQISPGTEIWLPISSQAKIVGDQGFSFELFEEIAGRIKAICPEFYDSLQLDVLVANAISATDETRKKVAYKLLNRMSCNVDRVDTRELGGAEQAGRKSFGTKSLENVVWIDQSVTGIFEHRTTFKDLTRGL